MATHSSIFTWEIPWMEEPGGLQSKRSHKRANHDLVTKQQQQQCSNYIVFITINIAFSWREAWQPAPVFLPGESHGWRSLEGYSSRGCKKSDRTKGTLHAHKHMCTQERSGKGRESVTHRGLMLRPSESKKKKLGTVWKPPEV